MSFKSWYYRNWRWFVVFTRNMTVYDRTIDVFNHLRVYAWIGGNPVAVQYRSYKPDITGRGTKLGERIGTSASGVAAPFDILRGWEVNLLNQSQL